MRTLSTRLTYLLIALQKLGNRTPLFLAFSVLAQKRESPTPLKPAKAVCPQTTAPQESQAAVPPSAPGTTATNLAPRKASRGAAKLPQSHGEAQPTGSKVKALVDERSSSQRDNQGSMSLSQGSEDLVPIVDIVSVASTRLTADSLADLPRQNQGRQAPILSALIGGGVPDSSEKASRSESSKV